MKESPRPLLQKVMNRAAKHLVPFQVTLELTHRCNLRCKHCYVDVPTGEELSLAELKGIFEQLAGAGTMYLTFTGGEVLTRPDFFDIAFYARNRGFIITFLTNGTLITPEIAGEIGKLGPLSVSMSLHGVIPATHDAITGKPGSFEATLRAIELLKGRDIPVGVTTVAMDTNIDEIDEIKDLARRLRVFHKLGYEFVPGRSGSLDPYRHAADREQVCRHFGQAWLEDGPDPAGVKGICKAGKGACSISPVGDVFPCLLMPMKVGNLRKATFDRIWHESPELTYLRSLTWGDLSACKDCSLAQYCTTCLGVAFSETGELTRPAPSACRNAALKANFLKRKGVTA
jgi:AdoMet-dependent heme synthase